MRAPNRRLAATDIAELAGGLTVEERLAQLEAELLTAQAAIAGFHARSTARTPK